MSYERTYADVYLGLLLNESHILEVMLHRFKSYTSLAYIKELQLAGEQKNAENEEMKTIANSTIINQEANSTNELKIDTKCKYPNSKALPHKYAKKDCKKYCKFQSNRSMSPLQRCLDIHVLERPIVVCVCLPPKDKTGCNGNVPSTSNHVEAGARGGSMNNRDADRGTHDRSEGIIETEDDKESGAGDKSTGCSVEVTDGWYWGRMIVDSHIQERLIATVR